MDVIGCPGVLVIGRCYRMSVGISNGWMLRIMEPNAAVCGVYLQAVLVYDTSLREIITSISYEEEM